MIVENFFEKVFYPNLKNNIETNSNYKTLVTKAMTQESKKFPIVPVRLLDVTNQYNNLSYGEETYTFSIEINIYSIDNEYFSKRTICNEITNTIVNYLKENYRLTIKTKIDTLNVDSNIQRNIIIASGKLDTKYGLDKLVIYPR